ncbi:uncharacterized protein CLUP02_18127 [Colletotrichum lupini]|uniref:Uncharacterized protein n=1 Tax=Colletotrichum lupini TaxID=145971 RepID=A0A9Q8WAZ0_9PEZI|nr:uncharacterized protein CLUP02_18127 [Colletotrichum lupini]UQC76614.1 hypothetical protein CLUP02_18127 [Colletotrichum lupini]
MINRSSGEIGRLSLFNVETTVKVVLNDVFVPPEWYLPLSINVLHANLACREHR